MSRITITCFIFILSLFMADFSHTAVTKFFSDASIKDFEKGDLKNVALDRNGHLSLSPNMKEVFLKQDILYVWDIVEDQNGNVYFGTGNKARIYRYSTDGEAQLFFQTNNGISITSLAVDSQNNLYAAVIQRGAIIKITPDGTTTVFAELKDDYIWKITFDSNDNLYVATGGSAGIYKISREGQIESLYKSKEESHFLCLDVANDGSVYFGSEGKGLVYKWNAQNQKVKVLFDTYEDEVKDLLIDSKGNIYFATATKMRKKAPIGTFNYKDTFVLYGSSKYQPRIKSNITKKKKIIPNKNSIYQLTAEGEVKKLMTKDNSIFISLALDNKEQLYAGTGDQGIIYKIKGVNDVSVFLDTKELQVMSLFINKQDNLFVTTGNVGKVLKMALAFSNMGTYYSRIFSANGRALWGNITWDVQQFPSSKINLYTRSGNTITPDNTWSPWSEAYSSPKSALIISPPARFIQYKVMLASDTIGQAPVLQKVMLSYLIENRAPEIENIRLRQETTKHLASASGPFSRVIPPSVFSLSWEAYDRDNDYMTYSIYFRVEENPNWMLLKKDLSNKRFSFDSRRLPDGNCYFKVLATDIKSNGRKRAKTGEAISKVFKLDNTPPVISDVKVEQEDDVYKITGVITDKLSHIQLVQYSLNGSDWKYLGPKDHIYDSSTEAFEISLDPSTENKLLMGKNVIVFRVADDFKNYAGKEVIFERKAKIKD